MTDKIKKFDLDSHLKSIAEEHVDIPHGISSHAIRLIKTQSDSSPVVFPYILAVVFAVNILISVFFGGILFLLRPISILQWIIIGSVYSTANVAIYGITFINYEKILNMLCFIIAVNQ